ncbi:MAG: response regulator [Gammaproteobacteria bacterium]|nr:response regulator [Gammaproteobacteria bacterium]MDX2486780.1 response regulator [Gammaproteobacteria bacterium]
MRILLVEDDALLGDGICVGLTQAGFTVDWVKDGKAGLAAVSAGWHELIILDLGLPGISGQELLSSLRKDGHDIPVLILTARDTVDQRIAGLDAGADDYMTKPFDLDELSARLRALLRRRSGRTAPLLTHGDIVLDPAAHATTFRGEAVNLSHREFSMLQLLLESAGRVLSRQHFEENLYGWDEEIESNAIEVHIHHLRKKLGSDLIRTVRGVGYTIDKKKPDSKS